MNNGTDNEKERKRFALIFTSIIGVGIAVLMFFWVAFIIPLPRPVDKEFVVDFGDDVKLDNSSVTSGGSSKNKATEEVVEDEVEEIEETPTETIEDPANVETQEKESVVESVKNPDPPADKPPTPTKKKEPKYQFAGSSGSSSSSEEEGTGKGEGDNDTGGEGNGTSNGFGNGPISGKLGNRGVVKYPGDRTHECQAQGKVVLDISVDRYGKVTRMTVNPSKTKTSNTCLINKAKELANQMKFQKGSKISEQGYVAFNFTLN